MPACGFTWTEFNKAFRAGELPFPRHRVIPWRSLATPCQAPLFPGLRKSDIAKHGHEHAGLQSAKSRKSHPSEMSGFNMENFTEGYVTAFPYTFGYYPELNPARALLPILRHGFAVP